MSGKPASSKGPSFTREQKGLLNRLISVIQPQIGQGVEAYPGPLVARPTPTLQEIFGQAYSLLPGFSTGEGYFAPGRAAAEALPEFFKPYSPEAAQTFWEQAYKAPTLETWKEDIIPQIMESYGAQNALKSSGLANALAKSGERLTTELGGQLAGLLYSGQQDWLNRQLSAVPLAESLGEYPTNVLGGVMGLAQPEYNIQQALTTEPYQKWAYSQPYANPWLQYLGGGALTTPGTPSVSTAGTPGAGDIMLSLLGAGLGGWGASGFAKPFWK